MIDRYVTVFLGVFRIVCFLCVGVYIAIIASHFWFGEGIALPDLLASLIIPAASVLLVVFSIYLERVLLK